MFGEKTCLMIGMSNIFFCVQPITPSLDGHSDSLQTVHALLDICFIYSETMAWAHPMFRGK